MYDEIMMAQKFGFFPLTTEEIDNLWKQLRQTHQPIDRCDVGRLLATIEWYQNREADLAIRLGNSRVELDLLFRPDDIDQIFKLTEEVED